MRKKRGQRARTHQRGGRLAPHVVFKHQLAKGNGVGDALGRGPMAVVRARKADHQVKNVRAEDVTLVAQDAAQKLVAVSSNGTGIKFVSCCCFVS